jgi:signal transduction histidine kinase
VGRPWQIWFLYFVGLAGLAGALSWLTVKALELDRAESLARRQAELEEDITAALWRMDSVLTPLLAEEAARPYQVYRAVYASAEANTKAATRRELSPLLLQPPPHAVLHFEMAANGQISSPQCPTGDDRAWAIQNGANPEAIAAFSARLTELHAAVAFPALLVQCSPPQPADSAPSGTIPGGEARQQLTQGFGSQSIFNPYEDSVQQQLKNLNAPPSQQAGSQPLPSATNTPFQTEDLQRTEQRPAGGTAQQELDSNFSFGNNSVESGRASRPQSRAGNDLAKRDAALQSYAQKAFEEQRANLKGAPALLRVVEGASRPLWMDGRLLVARRVQTGNDVVIQGCWLDWPYINDRLQVEVVDLLPAVELTAVTADGPIKISRLLASLPVQLVVPPLAPAPATWTPLRASLAVSWICLLVTAAAAALMLHSVMALSERRGAFVSAVTHELRTPLTTFRMYAEMLSAGMVPDAAQRQKYLDTLKIEADRLAHLVENVLQYARLERGRPGKRREEVSLAELLDRCRSRLADRAAQAEMKLDLELADADRNLRVATDAAAVEQILFNLVDNACKYAGQAADRRIQVSLVPGPKSVQLVVRDHGPGISAAGRKKLFQPFSKSVHEAASTAPGVGLGLALSRRLAAELGGRLELQSPPDGGAAFVLTLPR